jgi:hypothetical protein
MSETTLSSIAMAAAEGDEISDFTLRFSPVKEAAIPGMYPATKRIVAALD